MKCFCGRDLDILTKTELLEEIDEGLRLEGPESCVSDDFAQEILDEADKSDVDKFRFCIRCGFFALVDNT